MCGIVGVFSETGNADEGLKEMTDALAHRGPDAKNVYSDPLKVIGLGHTRLSIIDLSEAANQPFFSTDKRYVIVFNGEIYNFQTIQLQLKTIGCIFRTNSDTEVILQAFIIWGEHMIEKLEGMFAFAIFDHLERKLFLCRDRMGKKPLFYYQSEGFFAFASEIKSLLRHPAIRSSKKINARAIHTFLHLGYIPEPDSVYQSIFKFRAGHVGTVVLGKDLTVRSYWNIKEVVISPSVHDLKLGKEKLASLLQESIRKRLISDVPLGVFLSGGTDSSLIAAMAAKQSDSRLRTFCVGFNEDKYNEINHSRQVAKYLNTDHTDFILTERDAVDRLESYLRHFDEPFADTSAIPTMLVSELARKDVKVALTGDGGDELFLGYGAYSWAIAVGKG
jgi:asparagine synthase (glutamine-hydrolysing)